MSEITLKKLKCQRCGHEWWPEPERQQNVCPKCKSKFWRTPPNPDNWREGRRAERNAKNRENHETQKMNSIFNDASHLRVLEDAKMKLRDTEANFRMKQARPWALKKCGGFTWGQFADWFDCFSAELAQKYPDEIHEGTEIMQLITRANVLSKACRRRYS